MKGIPRSVQQSFLGLRFDSVSETGALDLVSSLAEGSEFTYIVTPNVDHVVRLHKDVVYQELYQVYEGAVLRLCDSRVLAILARISGITLEVVPGSDLTARLAGLSPSVSGIAIIGGDDKIKHDLEQRFPRSTWYQHIPPMGVLNNTTAQAQVVKFVEDCPAQVFLFAIGSPQSELLCGEIASRKKARGVALCVGASLEFLTGAKRRAPLWMQRASLEWLFRLLSEPKRLWRRYLVEGPLILAIWWRWRLNHVPPADGSDSS